MCSVNCLNLSPWLECCLSLKPKVFPQFSKQLTSVVCHVRVLPSLCMKPLPILHGMETLFQTFYDLEKAVDSVEYCILLKHLYSSGIHGKCWRIIQSFYDRPKGHVKVNGCLSPGFLIDRGVRQGSVLSPYPVPSAH